MSDAPPTMKPLRCAPCGGLVPLLAEDHVACPYCSELVVVPADYLQAARLRAREAEARVAALPLWTSLARGVSGGVLYGSLVSVALLPPLGATIANLVHDWASQGDVMALIALPLLLPGAALFLWASSVNETTLDYRASLGAKPPRKDEGPRGCRSCGAPLAAEADALFASCGYCGADSLLEAIPLGREKGKLKLTLNTLRDATLALRRRRRHLALGVSLITLTVGVLSLLLILAVRATL